jgi:hypothetical protein
MVLRAGRHLGQKSQSAYKSKIRDAQSSQYASLITRGEGWLSTGLDLVDILECSCFMIWYRWHWTNGSWMKYFVEGALFCCLTNQSLVILTRFVVFSHFFAGVWFVQKSRNVRAVNSRRDKLQLFRCMVICFHTTNRANFEPRKQLSNRVVFREWQTISNTFLSQVV